METNHLPHLISLIVNDDFFKNLSQEEQAIMTEAAELATEYAREQSDERIADRIAVIDESGTQVLTLSDEVRNKITEKLKSVYDSIQEAVSEDIYNTYLNAE